MKLVNKRTTLKHGCTFNMERFNGTILPHHLSGSYGTVSDE
jgi:hypothetical protein